MEYESGDEEYVAVIAVEEQFNSVTSTGNRNQVFATLTVNGKQEKFQLDSGSTVNIIADKTVKQIVWRERTISDSSVSLVMYSKSEIKPFGKKRFKVANPENKRMYSIQFLIAWRTISYNMAAAHANCATFWT